MKDVVIAGAARTPIGTFNGALSGMPASELGTIAIVDSVQFITNEPSHVQIDGVLSAAANVGAALGRREAS